MSQLMRLWYLSHRRLVKAQSLRCSHTWSMAVDEGSTKNQTSSSPLMAVHASLKRSLWRWKVPYHKNPGYLDIQIICCNHPKIWTRWLCGRVMHPKDAAGISVSVDPDQTAPLGPLEAVWSGSALFARKLRIATVISWAGSNYLVLIYVLYNNIDLKSVV